MNIYNSLKQAIENNEIRLPHHIHCRSGIHISPVPQNPLQKIVYYSNRIIITRRYPHELARENESIRQSVEELVIKKVGKTLWEIMFGE